MKKAITLTILSLFTLVAHAQRFDWVKTYTGPDISDMTTNKIVGSCVDNDGNLYILGEFSPQAQLCGVDLLPHEIITTPLHQGVVVAKLSPQGELLWHKSIYSNTGSYAFAMRSMGDTSFVVMTGFKMAHNNNGSLYYLDTLLTSADAGYLLPKDSTHSDLTNGFITFDRDGNVTEQYFVEIGFVDSLGHTIMYGDVDPSAPTYTAATRSLSAHTFCLDSVGNIYVWRNTTDYMFLYCDTCPNIFVRRAVDDGSIAGMNIYVNGNLIMRYSPSVHASTWNNQIMKFAPHFDSLIAAAYVFDNSEPPDVNPNIELSSLNNDRAGNLYISMVGRQTPSTLRIAGADSLVIDTRTDLLPTWLVLFNADLYPTGLIQLRSADDFPYSLKVLSSHLDENTNSLYVSGSCKLFSDNTVTQLLWQSDTINIHNFSGFWLRLNSNDLSLESYWESSLVNGGQVHSPVVTTYRNRVFAQTFFYEGMNFADTTIHAPTNSAKDLAFMVWGNDGQELTINTRGVSHPNSSALQPIVKDSIVYLTGSLYNNASWGDLSTDTWNNSYAYIARYIDTSFILPYTHENPSETQSIEWQQELSFSLSNSPIILTATSTSGLPVSYICSDTTIAAIDGSMLYLLTEGETLVTAYQEGDGHYLPAEEITKTLRITDVGIENTSPERFVVYPNPAKDAVYYSFNKKIQKIQVLSSTGNPVEFTFTNNKVDISQLPAGVFFLLFVTENNIYRYKIIKS